MSNTSNNPYGRPRLSDAKAEELKAAIVTVEQQPGRLPFFRHLVEQAYKDNVLLARILSKLTPDLKAVEIKTQQDSPYRLVIDVTPAITAAQVKSKALTGSSVPSGVPIESIAEQDAVLEDKANEL